MSSPVFAFHHGAGSSGRTFAVLSKKLRQFFTDQAEDGHVPGIIAYDIRHHGQTKIRDAPSNAKPDYSLEALSSDFLEVVKRVYERNNWIADEAVETVGSAGTTEVPPLLLVGHSLGGSVITTAASTGRFPAHIIGAVLLDIVEGSAVEALESMNMILNSRPKSFETLEKGIEWHIRSSTIRNRESASVSVPGVLTQNSGSDKGARHPWTWITNLRETEGYWPSWFKGLSTRFLTIPSARLLILAGTDRLDKELMIGQMQGKYQLIVFQDSGHFVQEDTPDKTALSLLDFWTRNDRPQNFVPTFGAFRKS